MPYCCQCGCSVGPDNGSPSQTQVAAGSIKYEPVYVFQATSQAALSDVAVDCSKVNAASIAVEMAGGSGATADITVKGSPTQSGSFQTLIDPRATKTVTGALIFDVLCGAAWLRLQLANVVGYFTISVTPYVSPGPSDISATVT